MPPTQAAVPVETSRVEFIDDNILIGSRVYRKGDVADIPTDRLKGLGSKVKSSDKDLTNFSGETPAPKPAKAK